ncbi:SusC/RagA family TonB-linked outer membrane protein [Sphingobacterium daejeonense]|jgi:TonB-linked SusC/RagA family outer membrane protein|uniref:SusC/RagA family TonB-linked outer membrane protein n=1 Tax=Sphingobacterium daejeonense TaxID=371142 RepID=A0ABW3RLK9_9SPHI|nr:TonB-dependent receptor [Sphingobacterium daejeonense]MCT1531602.1 TonB-dependent receptor [Sphingobacterium daejeonense]
MKKNYAFLSILMGLSLCSWADSRPAFLSENLGLKHSVYKQETIRGLVQSSTGESIAGASIRNLSTGSTVQSDAEGRFEIAGQVGQQLRISIIGYETQTLSISSSTMNVQLTASDEALEEVVVVGYGTQKKVNLTGAVATLGGEELESRPIANIGQGLQGQLPGLTIKNNNTGPGDSAPQIRIRGIGTWGDANPLVVIDGIPGGNMNILNPDDIENISVLKDAASSSIYGVRGANGVILVTTKKGKSGAPSLNFSSYYGWQTPTALPKFLGSVDYMILQNEANENAGQGPTYSEEQIEIARNGSDPNYFANTNWIDEVYKKSAPQQNYNLSLQGGSDKTSYYASYGYLGEGGLVIGDNFKAGRHNARLRMSTEILDRVQLDGNLGYVDRGTYGSASGNDPLSMATSIRPLVPVHFTNGSWGYHGGQSNPVAIATDGGTNNFTSQEITANISATINLMKGLDLRGQYGLVKYNSKRNRLLKTINYYSPDDDKLIYQSNFPNSIRMDHYSQTYQTFVGTATYRTTILDKHNITGLLGYSLEETVGADFWASRQNLPVQDLESLAVGTENQLNNSSSTQNALMSFFGRLNYDYQSKYLLEGNFRYDGSSRFHPDVRWNWFGSFSAGWVFSEEAFFQDLKSFWNFAKLRGSFGTQGNDKVGRDFPYMATLASVQITSNNPIGDEGQVGFRQTFIPNRFITWESSEKTNIGLDLAFLNSRLSVTGEYFINNTKSIILNPPLPDVIGVGTGYPAQNSGEVQNKGWEVVVGWKDKVGELSYSANFNLSDVKNKITKLENYATNLGDKVRLEGYPLDAFYGFEADRIAQESDFTVVDGKYVPNFPFQKGDLVAPGDLIYVPQDPDATAITALNDRVILGSDIPRYTYGFRGDLAYKGFDFSFFLQGVGKADGYLGGSARHPFINNSAMPQEIHLDRWTPENTDASYPRLVYMRTHNTRLSSKWIEDASYLRLKNIQLGYTFPTDWMEKVRVSKMRIFVSADNLFTKTNFFYGYDPEIPSGNTGNFYPQVKTYVVGINFNLK